MWHSSLQLHLPVHAHNHAGSTVAALGATESNQAILDDVVAIFTVTQSLNRGNVKAVTTQNRCQALCRIWTHLGQTLTLRVNLV